ncbi:hypothetical protein N9D99_04995 [Gammaproteobacteria bacterium]|nr:hypothetical protein [Gammaproteobacteria bacterium]
MIKKISTVLFLSSLIYCQQSLAQGGVFQTYQMNVSDPAAFVAAMDKYTASPTGQKSSANVFLYQAIANGENPSTHTVLVVHSSPEAMAANMATQVGSSDTATFQAEIAEAAQLVSSGMGQFLAFGGAASNITSPNPVGMFYQMSVSDPAAYAGAFSDLSAMNSDTGWSILSSSIADGTDPTTHFVVNWANSIDELLNNQPQDNAGWESFSQRVSNIRKVESTSILTTVASWTSE